LAERVAVEGTFIGNLAGQALTYAAVRLARDALARVRNAIEDARILIQGAPDWVARAQNLPLAAEVVEKRLSGKMSAFPVIQYDEVVSAMVGAFPLQAFEQLCAKDELDVTLTRIVNTSAPMEYVVFMVVRMAEQMGWIENLIRAAHAERHDHPGLATVYQKFQGQAL
jgi:hypothetical protein